MSQLFESNNSAVLESFWKYHFFAVVSGLLVLIFVIEIFNIDFVVADYIYNSLGGKWELKDNYITSTILHDYAQKLSQGVAIIILGIALLSNFVDFLLPYKKGLWLVILSLVFSAATVGVLKEFTNVHCPWDLIRYGGLHEYLSTYEPSGKNIIQGRCFPAGHASGGYGYIVLYFLFLHYKPEWKWRGLSFGLVLGAIYGLTQQLRGAHFLSHDVWTILVCWLTALSLYSMLLKDRRNV